MPLSPLEGLKVFVAMPCLEAPKLHTTMSMLDTQEKCHEFGIAVEFAFVTGSLVHHARSLLANVFLSRDDDLFFSIDSDMKWTPADFVKLLVNARKYDITLGVYPRRRPEGGIFIQFVDDDAPPNEDGLVEIVHTGMGFSCIRRHVIKHLAGLSPKLKHAHDGEPFPALFRMDDDGTAVRGEDYAFWADCREAGYKIYADTAINIGHVGTMVFQCSSSAK
jgi:hypothetical protein